MKILARCPYLAVVLLLLDMLGGALAAAAGSDPATPEITTSPSGKLIPAARATASVATPAGALRYVVTWAEWPVTDAGGTAHATISALTYERAAGRGAATRPSSSRSTAGPALPAPGSASACSHP
ncbi:MAG: hypothetical protein IT481_14405 [Gammaproteobacteria bacterium]|nr:hypothetical protein [Gammaproteobacteria bacterium]